MTQPTLHTHIELGEDEGIVEDPMIGDRIEWNVSGGPRNIYIKPSHSDLDTSLTLVTNKRVYQLQLLSGSKNSQVYQKVSFDYPDRDAAIKLRQEQEAAKESTEKARLASQIVGPDVDPSSLNFDYTIVGNAEFKPTSAYTDGKFTYLRLPNTQDSPAVFLMDDAGNPSLINYAVKGNLIIVERVAKQLLLKLGDAEVRVIQRPSKGHRGQQNNG
jgi:type IV secretion system protein VirB9